MDGMGLGGVERLASAGAGESRVDEPLEVDAGARLVSRCRLRCSPTVDVVQSLLPAALSASVLAGPG